MELLPMHQILEGGKLGPSFKHLWGRSKLTFRSTPEMEAELKRLVSEWIPHEDFSNYIFLGNEHGLPKHMNALHMYIHSTGSSRGVECYIRLAEKTALIVE
jgi:hypothetical protein